MEHHNIQQTRNLKDINEIARCRPFKDVSECFRVDVSTHTIRCFIKKLQLWIPETFVQPLNRYAVSTADVAHRWVSARPDNIDHGLVVFVNNQSGLSRQNPVPKVQKWHATKSHGRVPRHDLSLWGRVGNTALTLADSSHREARRLTTDGKMVASCGPQGCRAPRKVRIRIQMRLH